MADALKIAVFIVSNGGLVILVCLYAVLGGVLFQALEKESELASKKGLSNMRDQVVGNIWNTTRKYNVLHFDNWTKEVEVHLRAFEEKIYIETTENGWDGTEGDSDAPSKWTLPGAMLFAITVITTIGYGEIVPKTQVGQVVCIIYAVIGIPLTLLCLANLGAFLANFYRFTWKHLAHAWRTITCTPNERLDRRPYSRTKVPITMSITTMVAYVMLGAWIFSSWEKDWSFLDGSYFSFITLSTIGFGDYVPGQEFQSSEKNKTRLLGIAYMFVGMALLIMCFGLISQYIENIIQKNEQQIQKTQGGEGAEGSGRVQESGGMASGLMNCFRSTAATAEDDDYSSSYDSEILSEISKEKEGHDSVTSLRSANASPE